MRERLLNVTMHKMYWTVILTILLKHICWERRSNPRLIDNYQLRKCKEQLMISCSFFYQLLLAPPPPELPPPQLPPLEELPEDEDDPDELVLLVNLEMVYVDLFL